MSIEELERKLASVEHDHRYIKACGGAVSNTMLYQLWLSAVTLAIETSKEMINEIKKSRDAARSD